MLLNLRTEMIRNNVTQLDLAKDLNLHPNSIKNKIDGKSKFTIAEAFVIAEKFKGVELKYLFSETDPTPN